MFKSVHSIFAYLQTCRIMFQASIIKAEVIRTSVWRYY